MPAVAICLPAGAGASAPGGLALVQVATDTESLLALASSYQADGNRVAAAACYSRALRLQPDCEAAKAGLAQVRGWSRPWLQGTGWT